MYKNHFFSLVILFLMSFAISAIAATTEQLCDSKDIFHQQWYQLGYLKIGDEKELNVASYITPIKTLNRSGCCSWHEGVCGCSSGRTVCCDGSYSPTCGC